MIAAVLAGGRGERMGGHEPKQFRELAGKPMLAHSLLAFERAPQIQEVVLVSHVEHAELAERVARDAGVTKLSGVVPGGPTRRDSSQAALATVAHQEGLILIHDAARPLIAVETIASVVAALTAYRAVAPAIPATDTIVAAHDDLVTAVPPRGSLRRMQTPQGFEIATIREAYRLASEDATFVASDDCGVVHRYLPEVAIKLVAGSARNLKVTHEEDLRLAELLLAS